jgi:hypothetical protein
MMLRPCAREKEIAELLRLGHWPAAASAELRDHASRCESCCDLLLVTESFRQARELSSGTVRLQSPGILWWRAQLRRRSAAVERISKPVVGAQIFAFAVTLLFAVGFVVFQATHGLQWLSWFRDLSRTQFSYVDALRSIAIRVSEWGLVVVVPGAIALILMSGVVLYLASERR